jgi:hypothetical protein
VVDSGSPPCRGLPADRRYGGGAFIRYVDDVMGAVANVDEGHVARLRGPWRIAELVAGSQQVGAAGAGPELGSVHAHSNL